MKLSLAVLAAVVSAEEKKVPPRHPLQRLKKLVEFSEEIMTNSFGFLPSQEAWIAKFATNAGRMQRNFERGNQRCGFYDADSEHGGPASTEAPTAPPTEPPTYPPTAPPTEPPTEPATEKPTTVENIVYTTKGTTTKYTTKAPKKKGGKNKGGKNKKDSAGNRYRRELGDDFDRYDREDPSVAVKQITTGFSKWAVRYLSACSGQKFYNFQTQRMARWNKTLQAHLANNEYVEDNVEEEVAENNSYDNNNQNNSDGY